jgi:hypothetical protein
MDRINTVESDRISAKKGSEPGSMRRIEGTRLVAARSDSC